MKRSERVVKLTPECRCGHPSAVWKGPRLYCSRCDILIRFKGQGRTEASKPVAVLKRKIALWDVTSTTWKPQPLPGCGNGMICGECWKCS